MRILVTPEARSHVLERGGLLFVRIRRGVGVRAGGIAMLEASTDPPIEALEWRRFETRGLLVFVPPTMRLPRTLQLDVGGRLRRRIRAFWNGCAYVM